MLENSQLFVKITSKKLIIFWHYRLLSKIASYRWLHENNRLLFPITGIDDQGLYKVILRANIEITSNNYFFQKLFYVILYQLQNISFVCSVYQTVLLAFQRYLAISKPMEYYASQSVTASGLYFILSVNLWFLIMILRTCHEKI